MMLKKLNQKDHVINLYRPAPVFWPIWISLDHVVMHKHQLGRTIYAANGIQAKFTNTLYIK